MLCMASKWDIPSSSGAKHATNETDAESIIQNLKLLKPLDEILRCPICFEYFIDCMMTKCGHNYCSLCIRRYMMYKSQCPTCFQVTSEPELKNNRLIDEILAIYKTLRNKIEKKQMNPCLTNSSDSLVKESGMLEEKVAKIFIDKVQSDSGSQQKEFEKVPCPVCNLLVSPIKINAHLDDCLLSNERIVPTSPTNKTKLLPKVVYHLLTDNEIKKHLKQHGLCISGDRQALIRRHKNFIVLYNANCDSLSPRPVSELVEQIEFQEFEERANNPQHRIHLFHKKSELALIEKEQELYLRKHCDQFDALIEDVRTRLQTQEDDSDSSPFEDNPSNNSSIKNEKHPTQNR